MQPRVPIQAFELPDKCAADRVRIFKNSHPDKPECEAIPYMKVETWANGREVFEEPAEFEVTDRYRAAIEELSFVPIEDIQLELPDAIHAEPLL